MASSRRWSAVRRAAGPLLGVGLLVFALVVLREELASLTWAEVRMAAAQTSAVKLLAAVTLTALSYLAQTRYDTLALRQAGHPLRWREVLPTALLAQVVSYNLGLSMLTGGSVRARAYAARGLGGVEIAQVVGTISITFWLGFAALAGGLWCFEGLALPSSLPIPSRVVGAGLLLLPVAWSALGAIRREPLRFRGHTLVLPPPGLALEQVATGVADWAAAIAVVVVLLPGGPAPLEAAGLVLLAHLLASISQSPGGIGVFEASLVLLLGPWLPAEQALAAALLYRLIYFLAPLGLVLSGLGLLTWRTHRQRVHDLGGAAARIAAGWVPTGMAVLTFTAGAILFLTGALPAEQGRLLWMHDLFPLPLIEGSHLIGSLAGCALMLQGRALQQRLTVAWTVSVGLLVGGLLLALLRGGDLEEATVLALALAGLVGARPAFYRRSSLEEARFTPGWLLATAVVIGATVWVGLIAYRHVEYAPDLWWQFAWSGDAPRFLRGTLAGVVGLALAGGVWLLRPSTPPPQPPSAAELDTAAQIAAHAEDTDAWLALLGDKRLLFAEDGAAFVMYAVQGRSWVSLGGPVGDPAAAPELAWRFREQAIRAGFRPVFYQIAPEELPLYIDLGLVPFKIGEEARVDLARFSLEGAARKKLRAHHNKLLREGVRLSVVERADVPALLPELRAISDAWLESKSVREKGFSLGAFREDYLRHFRIARVEHAGRTVAFANLWEGGAHGELSIDLMRFGEDAPSGVMEFLFVALMLWGHEGGWQWFNLGSVPLSGLEDRPGSSLWQRIGAQTFRHGEHFYNFEGLRQYKEKFDPVWSPRYLMVPSARSLVPALLDVVALTSGGLLGALKR